MNITTSLPSVSPFRNNYGSPFPTFRSADWPTFWEFVQYVNSHAKLTTLDPHWRPVYVFCTPCSFYFKYLLKFENIKVSLTRR